MEGSTIFFIVFFGFFFGVLFGYLIHKSKGNLQKKNAIKKIKNQKMKYSIGGKENDFIGKINKDNTKTKVEEIIPPRPRQVQKKIMRKPKKKVKKIKKRKKK